MYDSPSLLTQKEVLLLLGTGITLWKLWSWHKANEKINPKRNPEFHG